MTTAYLLLLIGLTDLVRGTGARRSRPVLASGLAALIAGLGGLLGFVQWGWAAAMLVICLCWLWAGHRVRDDRARDRWTLTAFAGVIAVVIATLFAAPGVPTALEAAFMSSPAAARIGVPLATIVAALGVGAAMVVTGNRVCRAVLDLVTTHEVPSPGDAPRVERSSGWWANARRAFRREVTPADGSDIVVPRGPVGLKGGRVIGPLERLILVVLLVFGMLPVIGGLVAAKGIVRFPEIAGDEVGGSKAEEFLVGSLVSWAFAGLGALAVIIAV